MKLFDNLHYYIWQGKGNNCNTYVFANVLGGDRPHVLIDPGHVMNETKETCLDTLLKGMVKVAEGKILVKGLKGPLEEGWQKKVEAFVSHIPVMP